MGRNKASIACDITPATRQTVSERDGCCIICGTRYMLQTAHYIPRSQLGLGIKENLVMLCAECHRKFDNGDKREEYGETIKEYLKGWYPDIDYDNPELLIYDRWRNEDYRLP